MQVTVYSTTTCPYCKMLKSFLSENGVVFKEKLVDQDEVARDEMMGKSGGYLGVPFCVIVKDDGKEEKVIGFDKQKISGILGLNTGS